MSGSEWTWQQEMALERMSGALSIDELVDEIAQHGPHHNERAITVHASQTGISLARRRRRDAWDDEQDAVLRACTGLMTAAEIAVEIRQQLCWLRTEKAVWARAEKLHVSLRTAERPLTLRALMAIFPSHNSSITHWVEQGYLRAQRPSDGHGGSPWRFTVADVETFVRAYPWLIDWRRVQGSRWQDLARIASLRSPWLSVEQVASVLRRRPAQVRALARDGRIEGAIRDRYCWRLPREAVEQWGARRAS